MCVADVLGRRRLLLGRMSHERCAYCRGECPGTWVGLSWTDVKGQARTLESSTQSSGSSSTSITIVDADQSILLSTPMSLPTSMIMSVLSIEINVTAPSHGVRSFCPDVLAVAFGYKLPTDNNVTCGIAGAYVVGLSPRNPLCLASYILCCLAPPSLAPASLGLAQDTAAKMGTIPCNTRT